MIRRLLVPLVLLALCAGCSSTGGSSNGPDIKMHLVQATPIPDFFYFGGPVSVQYQLAVENPTNQPVTLRRLELQSVSDGAYRLRTDSTVLNLPIPPGGHVTVPLSAWAYARGGYLRAEEPVSIRTIGWFEGPSGRFSKGAIDMLRPR
jgi:hypothetical protein